MNRTWHQNAIALTGIIGSGKSSVATFLAEAGAFVVRADDLAKEVVKPGSAGLKAIEEQFGKEVLTQTGELNRKKMAEIVFSAPEMRERLEAITHPAIRALGAEIFEAAYDKDYPLYVYEIPLLFEVKLENAGWKSIVLVTAPKEECIKRIMKRDSLNYEEALARFNSQIPLERKRELADIAIENDGTLEQLKKKTFSAFDKLST